MLNNLIWFVLGAISCRLISSLIALRLESLLAHTALLWTGRLFLALSDDIEKSLEFKHRAIKQSEVPEYILKKMIEEDKEFLSQWKVNIFTTVVGTIPQKYIRYVPHYIWDDKMSLDEIIEKLEEDL